MGGARSLRARLLLLWLLSLAAAAGVAALILALDRASTAARTAEAEVTLARAAERLAGAYDFYAAGLDRAPDDPRFVQGLGAVVRAALAGAEGVEGGSGRNSTARSLMLSRPMKEVASRAISRRRKALLSLRSTPKRGKSGRRLPGESVASGRRFCFTPAR